MKSPSGKNAATIKLLQALDALKTVFTPEATVTKESLLAALSNRTMVKPNELFEYHDHLLFILAYPDNQRLHDFAEQELQQFGKRIKAYIQATKDKQAEKLIDSGLVHTAISHTFGYEIAQALHNWHPGQVEIDWEYYNEEDDPLVGILPLITAWNESDSLDNDPNITGKYWFEKTGKKSPLHALLQMLASSPHADTVKRYLYESMDLSVRWQLVESNSSRTRKRIPSSAMFLQTEPIKGRTKDLRMEFQRPLVPMTLLSESEGTARVRDIQEVLAVRNRELFPLAGATPKEVYLVSPGRGLEMYIYGTLFGIRLPLEANFGAMLVRNGVPIGYGVAAVLLDRVEIAINIFPAYRNGESSFAIEEYFRIFYHHFGSREFLVRAYQIGEDNEEALQSGSYWFYYKLGFRSVDKSVRKLADAEYKKIQSKNGYRTPIKTLKQLATSDMFMTADIAHMNNFSELSIINLSYVATKWMCEQADNDRRIGTTKAVDKLKAILSIASMNDWTVNEKDAFARLAPLIASIADISSWSNDEKALLVKLMRAKGSDKEWDFVLLSNQHEKFKSVLRQLAKK